MCTEHFGHWLFQWQKFNLTYLENIDVQLWSCLVTKTPPPHTQYRNNQKKQNEKKKLCEVLHLQRIWSLLSHFSCKNVQIKGGSNPQPQSEWSSKICCSRTGWCWQTWKKTRKPLPPVPLQTLTAVLLFATVNISNKHEQGRSALSLLMQCDAYQHSWYTERDRNFCSDASSLLM